MYIIDTKPPPTLLLHVSVVQDIGSVGVVASDIASF